MHKIFPLILMGILFLIGFTSLKKKSPKLVQKKTIEEIPDGNVIRIVGFTETNCVIAQDIDDFWARENKKLLLMGKSRRDVDKDATYQIKNGELNRCSVMICDDIMMVM